MLQLLSIFNERPKLSRRWVALSIELPLSFIVGAICIFFILQLVERAAPRPFQLYVYAQCPKKDMAIVERIGATEAVDKDGVPLPKHLWLEVDGEDLRATLRYPGIGFACDKYLIMSSLPISKVSACIRPSKPLENVGHVKNVGQFAHTSYLFFEPSICGDKADIGASATLQFSIVGAAAASGFRQIEIISRYAIFSLREREFPPELGHFVRQANRAVNVVRFRTPPNWMIEKSIPPASGITAILPITNERPRAPQPSDNNRPDSAGYHYKYEFSDAKGDAFRVVIEDVDRSFLLQLWLMMATTILGIAIGFFVDSIKVFSRGT